ncbi:MAG: heparan-alpha-glucosaminide N-acetyltransferase domain-containing protein, partial [Candidatus Acetothermia bacterium]
MASPGKISRGGGLNISSVPKKELRAEQEKNPRYWEIDFLRGSGVILMVGYHALFDLVNLDV